MAGKPKAKRNNGTEALEELNALAAAEDELEDNIVTVFASQLALWHEYDGQRTLKVTRYRTIKALDPEDATLKRLADAYAKDRDAQMELEHQMLATLREILEMPEFEIGEVLSSGHTIVGTGIFKVPDILKAKLVKAIER